MSRTYTDHAVVRRHIQSGEEQIIAVRRHPIVLTAPIATIMGAVAVAVGVSLISKSKLTLVIVLLFSGFLVCSQIAAFVSWNFDFFVVTSKKLILSTSPFATEAVTTKLPAIAKISVQRSWRGYLLGYGTLVIRAADEGELAAKYIPYPQQIYQELSQLIQNIED